MPEVSEFFTLEISVPSGKALQINDLQTWHAACNGLGAGSAHRVASHEASHAMTQARELRAVPSQSAQRRTVQRAMHKYGTSLQARKVVDDTRLGAGYARTQVWDGSSEQQSEAAKPSVGTVRASVRVTSTTIGINTYHASVHDVRAGLVDPELLCPQWIVCAGEKSAVFRAFRKAQEKAEAVTVAVGPSPTLIAWERVGGIGLVRQWQAAKPKARAAMLRRFGFDSVTALQEAMGV